MAQQYADRIFVAVNGVELQDVQSAHLKANFNARAVKSMTRKRFNQGMVTGNVDLDITLKLALQNLSPRPKLEFLDYQNNDVSLNWLMGADQFVIHDLFIKETDDDGAGVGEEVKTDFAFGALSYTDAVGNGELFVTSISSLAS